MRATASTGAYTFEEILCGDVIPNITTQKKEVTEKTKIRVIREIRCKTKKHY